MKKGNILGLIVIVLVGALVLYYALSERTQALFKGIAALFVAYPFEFIVAVIFLWLFCSVISCLNNVRAMKKKTTKKNYRKDSATNSATE